MAMLHQSNYAMQRNSKQQPGKNGPLKDCVTYCASRLQSDSSIALHQFHVNLCPTPCSTYIIHRTAQQQSSSCPSILASHPGSVHKTNTLCNRHSVQTLNSLILHVWGHKCAPITCVQNIPTQSQIPHLIHNLRILPKYDIRECDSTECDNKELKVHTHPRFWRIECTPLVDNVGFRCSDGFEYIS
jgi:hypothetical protein